MINQRGVTLVFTAINIDESTFRTYVSISHTRCRSKSPACLNVRFTLSK